MVRPRPPARGRRAASDAEISDGTWNDLAARYDTKQRMDVVFTVGQCNLVSIALRTFRVPLDEEVEGFRASSPPVVDVGEQPRQDGKQRPIQRLVDLRRGAVGRAYSYQHGSERDRSVGATVGQRAGVQGPFDNQGPSRSA